MKGLQLLIPPAPRSGNICLVLQGMSKQSQAVRWSVNKEYTEYTTHAAI